MVSYLVKKKDILLHLPNFMMFLHALKVKNCIPWLMRVGTEALACHPRCSTGAFISSLGVATAPQVQEGILV